ncbi:MAG: right-handed parallel beta-helix repeat-containing protein [Steroidobacteraceae bacterium]
MSKLLQLIGLSFLLCASASAEVITVAAPQTIQSAVNRAKPGDTVRVMPGLYAESVFVDKDRIGLTGVVQGDRWPTLDGANVRNDGILVSGHGVTVEHFLIKRYLGNGIMIQGANNFAVLNNRVEGPGFYGIFPQYGRNGLVAHNVISGIGGSAMYIGMSQNIDVVHNETANNAGFGIEVENSRQVLIEGNYSHGNLVGVVLNLIPGLPTKSEEQIVVRNNFIIGNKPAELSAEAKKASVIDSGSGEPPGGTGLLINGADASTIQGNVFEDNPGAAIFVMDHNFGQLFPVPDPKVDPLPDDTKILTNHFYGNGRSPFGRTQRVLAVLKQTQAPDLLVAGSGRRNCVMGKASLSTLGADVWTECPAGSSSEALRTMRLDKPVQSPSLTLEQRGRLTWLAVCTGCHSFSSRLHGPPMVAARAPYMGNPQKLADWIAHPTKKRADYAAMPPQNYLPPEVRLQVAKYVLGYGNLD